MRLKSVYISEYKNLKDFSLNFDNDSFIDIFVGKNGSGKSNFLEAIILVFQHLYEQNTSIFDYKLAYEIDSNEIKIEWKNENFFIDDKTKGQKTLGKISLPENILIYYSGHNKTITKLVNKYEDDFRKKIKGANVSDSRKFIGIGSEYKNLLLSILLLQTEDNQSKKYIFEKLGIKEVKQEIILCLKRPSFAEGRLKTLEKEIGLSDIDNFDTRTHYWGADGITKDFLDKLIQCIKGKFDHTNIYNGEEDKYKIPINIELFQKIFEKQSITEQFQSFDNLKTLGILDSIDINILLLNGLETNLNHFSDGQFQALYIYAITEIFKEKNCITLLDEPDSFLHPEWQFQFLQQIFDISEKTPKNNHILMCSHSASTITKADENTINMFELNEGKTSSSKISKNTAIQMLSQGLIKYSEDENNLRIDNVIRTSNKPILFVEGPSDALILETAYRKLYETNDIPILFQDAFDRGFIKTLISRAEIYKKYPEKLFFALFDFDDAYEDWRLLDGEIESNKIEKGFCKKIRNKNLYAFLLPITDELKHQVWNEDDPIEKIKKNPHFCIEHIFYKVDAFKTHFKDENNKVKFKGDKIKFAQELIPNLDKKYFAVFRPMFEFIKSKCK